MIPLALICGAVVGLALGALGGGGSMLAIPELIYLLGFTPAQATTASMLIVVVTSLTGLFTYARTGQVRWRVGAVFAVAGVPAAAAAGALSAAIPGDVLTVAFATLAVFAAWRMLRPSRTSSPAEAAGPVRIAATGTGLGAVTGLLGVGGGFLAVPALVSVLALPMSEATGTSLLVIGANAGVALTTRLGTALATEWTVVGPFIAAAIISALAGKSLAGRLCGGTLQRIFAGALLTVAGVMLAGVVI